MPEWIKSEKYAGVRYRVHPTRKDGVESAKYIAIFYKLDGKMRQETLGWSDKKWVQVVPDGKGGTKEVVHKINEKRAFLILSELQENQRLGRRPRTLKEMRDMAAQEQKEIEAEAARAEKENVTLAVAFDAYLSWAKSNKKDWDHDQTRMTLHVLPLFGEKRLADIGAADLEQLKVRCQEKSLSPATTKHVLQCVRAIYNYSQRVGIYFGDNPTRKVKFPKLDNARIRFFTEEQADQLLGALWERSVDVHDMALLSLLTGLRFSEVARLRWEFVNQDHGVLNIVDTKSGSSRQAYIDNEELAEMFQRRRESAMGGLVFPGPIHGGVMKDCPDVFVKTVNGLGFNDGITDTRQRLTFHSLRHTFASWLALRGTPVFTLKELMGHKTIEMTMRYSHLMPDQKRAAVVGLTGRTKAKVIPLRQAR